MRDREVHLELLIDRCVMDADGQKVGRLEEARVVRDGEHWVISEFHLGTAGALERFSARRLGHWIVRLLGAHNLPAGKKVRWDQLDLSDPNRPILLCRYEELEEVDA